MSVRHAPVHVALSVNPIMRFEDNDMGAYTML